jgi:VIT1/CCC1 family predicted Fe2+/Mn2+ transporter
MAAYGRWPVALWRLTVLIIVVHVTLVWHVRYEWQFSEATRDGYDGFAIFHAALIAIVPSLFVEQPIARRLVTAAFAVITVGAIAVTSTYVVGANYRMLVIAIALAGVAGLAFSRLSKRMAEQG